MKSAIKLALVVSALAVSTSAFASPQFKQDRPNQEENRNPAREMQFEGQKRPHDRMHPPKLMQDINMRNVVHKILEDCKSKESPKLQPDHPDLRKPVDKSEKLTKAQCDFFKEKKDRQENPNFDSDPRKQR